MNIQHKNLAAGQWQKLTLIQQLANIGSEVFRALKWQEKQKTDFSQKAFIRSLELIDLSLATQKNYPTLKELARLRTNLVDYFAGENQFKTKKSNLEKYFYSFTYAANLNK